MPKEPRQRKVSNSAKSGDTVTRNIVIGMIALVVLSGVIFTILDKRSGSSVALPASIESISSANNGEPLTPTISPEADYGVVFNTDSPLKIDIWEDFQCPYCKFFEDAMGDYLETLIREKQAEVTYHMASFLGQESVRAPMLQIAQYLKEDLLSITERSLISKVERTVGYFLTRI